MKIPNTINRVTRLACLALALGSANASENTWGTLNNFDTVNPETEPCHGFEIELEDCHSSDITYTYNWNHYGVPKITEDNSVAGHPRCVIRWASAKNPDGTWAAYTAVPTEPIPPTNGHMFTNPSVNFGGEHFGAGYRGAPTVVRYFWLIDNGAGELVHGSPVQVSTPTFNYAAGAVQAAIKPVEPVEVPVREFGEATWVKEIKTTTHNNNEVKLRDLVSDDPDDDNEKNWKNGEPDEVEVEWQLLQEEFAAGDGGGNGVLEGAPEDLDNGDEIITRRWEFYAYTGPHDPESYEAIADNVADDNLHGVGVKTSGGIDYDLENTIVVGDFLGAQMSAFDVDGELSLIDHLQDFEVGEPAPDRRVVIGAAEPFVASGSGDLPDGMEFDPITGIISGTPTASGEFSYTVQASDAVTPAVTKTYTFRVAEAGLALPPHSVIDTAAYPANAGITTGDGSIDNGLLATVTATPNPGYAFVNWTDNGTVVSQSASYEFTVDINRSLVAVFEIIPPAMHIVNAGAGSFTIEWAIDPPGWILQESTTLGINSWLDSTRPVVDTAGMHRVAVTPGPAENRFFRLKSP